MLLNGASLSDTAYIHVLPNDNVSRVRFYLDNPGRNSVFRVENIAPYDFGGTNGNGTAGGWNPGSVSSGL